MYSSFVHKGVGTEAASSHRPATNSQMFTLSPHGRPPTDGGAEMLCFHSSTVGTVFLAPPGVEDTVLPSPTSCPLVGW